MTPQRIQRLRTKGARQPPNTRYCGRGTGYANTHKVEPDGECFKVFDADYFGGNYRYFMMRKDAHVFAIELFKKDTEEYMALNPKYFEPLRGFDFLSCFCPPSLPCHVDVLIECLQATP